MAAPYLVQNLDFLNDPARLQAVREADRQIEKGITEYQSIRIEARRKVTFLICWESAVLRQLGGFRLLGFRYEADYWKAKLRPIISRSNWFNVVGIAERLSHLGREQFLALPSIEAAEVLSRQEPAVRVDPEILERVQTTSARKLKQELATGDEPCVWKLMLPRTDRDAIQSGVGIWAKEHGIQEDATALRLIVTQCVDRGTLVGLVTEWYPRLEAGTSARTVQELQDLRDEVKAFVGEVKQMLDLDSNCS